MSASGTPAEAANRDEERIPVVVAAGQTVARDGAATVLGLAEAAARQALEHAPGLADAIDRVSLVDALSPTGKAPAAALTRRLGLRPAVVERTAVGGNSPQWLVERAAADIAAGRLDATLVAGAEAIASRRAGTPPDVDDDEGPPDPVVGDDRDGTSPQEAAIELRWPAHVYPLLEAAVAHRQGRDPATHRRVLGELLAPFTRVAADHPVAWFRQERSPEDIATPSADNRLTAQPYTLRMNAILSVDQGAALLLTSLAQARRAGVADRAVFVWSAGSATDAWYVPTRPDLAASPGIAAAGAALAAAGLDVDDLELIDLYSCFPVAVELAADALGLATDDPRGLTVTGGLPYFGGPGNDYTTHAIATLTDTVRERGTGLGLATGLGWFATKHAVGIYGAAPPPAGFQRADTSAEQARIDAAALELADHHEGAAVIDAATVVHARDGTPEAAPAYLRLPDGRRLVAAADPADVPALVGVDPVGARVHVAGDPPVYRVVELEPSPGRTP